MSANAAKETETLMRLNFTQQSKIVVEISRCGQKKAFFRGSDRLRKPATMKLLPAMHSPLVVKQ